MKRMKCKTEDYSDAHLPETRKAVFMQRYKEHFSLILYLGFFVLLFMLPMLLITLARDVYIITAAAALEEQTAEAKAGVYYTADAAYGLMQVLAFTLFSVLFSGIVQILRQLLWDEPVFFGDDFKKGFQSNAFRYGVTGVTLAVIYYYSELLDGSVMTAAFFGLFPVTILPVAIWLSLYGIYYQLGIFLSIKSAIMLYLKTFPATLLLLVCTVTPFWVVLNLIPLLMVKYLVYIALAVLYVIPLTMCWMLYASHVFDQYINKEHYPSMYRKGMRKEAAEDKMQEI